MDAAYVFRVRFRLDPADVWVDPNEFQTVLRVPAAEPGEKPGQGDVVDWLFFRDNLWRGEVNAEDYLRESASDLLGVPVSGVSFRDLETTEAYLESLRAGVADDLDEFNADSVDDALTKYLGSSIRVVEAVGSD